VNAQTDSVVAAVDWGTTSFRVWLLNAQGEAIAESRSDEGLLKAAETGFGKILEDHLRNLGADSELPVIVCGMAGSRQGWMEAPYTSCPAKLLDIPINAVAMPGTTRQIRILPGIAQRRADDPDVMRGEETQLLGLGEKLDKGSRLVCMPGTHCKWVVTEDGKVERFATWTTGELFNLMSTASILRHSIDGKSAKVSPGDPVFHDWAKRGLAEPEATFRHFFTIRAATLLGNLETIHAAAALSGLLIGSEIASALSWSGDERLPIILVASGNLSDLYSQVLAQAGMEANVEDADAAVRAGLFLAYMLDSGQKKREATA
jgi:2-dehydro-3-deoxygalactonokinase